VRYIGKHDNSSMTLWIESKLACATHQGKNADTTHRTGIIRANGCSTTLELSPPDVVRDDLAFGSRLSKAVVADTALRIRRRCFIRHFRPEPDTQTGIALSSSSNFNVRV
jgi:hypothetical protein